MGSSCAVARWRLSALGRYALLLLYASLWAFALLNYSSRCVYNELDVFSDTWPKDDPRHRSGSCWPRRSDLQLQQVAMEAVAVQQLEAELTGQQRPQQLRVRPGGSWAPANCTPLQRVALLVGFQNRHRHLPVLLRRLHPMLQRQRATYTIFVIEQQGEEPFNRGMLKNIGVVEALKVASFDCFIFHDVDMIPENDRNVYMCDDQARHLASAIDEMRYHVMYYNYVGGVLALSRRQYFRINGHSNVYWGWGNEDDDISARALEAQLLITRPPEAVGRFRMLRHVKDTRVEGGNSLFAFWRRRQFEDGLSSLDKDSYTVLSHSLQPLYTNITVRLNQMRHRVLPQWLQDGESWWWFLRFYFP